MSLRIPRSHPHQKPPKRILANSQEERDLNWRLSLMGLPPIQGAELTAEDMPAARPSQQVNQSIPADTPATKDERKQLKSVENQYNAMHRAGAALFKSKD